MRRVVIAGGLVMSMVGAAQAGLIDPVLDDVLRHARPDEVVSALVYLTEQVDLAGMTDVLDARRATPGQRHETIVRALWETASATQGVMTDHLDALVRAGAVESFEAFWIRSIVRVDAVPAEIRALADRADVDRVYLNHPIELVAPVRAAVMRRDDPAAQGGIEPGVAAIRAPEVWAMGITGKGVLTSTLDTGVDGVHETLRSRWRGFDPRYAGHPGWAWFDPETNVPFPVSFGFGVVWYHGTQTMSIVCGGAPGDLVGVAPGAKWIHAAVIDRVSVDRSITDAILAFQWVLDPDEDASTSWDVPDVCSNSWGLRDELGYPDCDETFWSFLDACEAVGIVMIFSAGNEGEEGLGRPADRATDEYRTLAVAAVDANDPSWPIADFSSRGPTSCTPDGSEAIKPDIAGPGVNVRSASPGDRYDSPWTNGTSFASPHVNGVVALMLEANPELGVEAIKQIIYDTAVDLGDPGEDNAYGHGMPDAFEAVTRALEAVTLRIDLPDGRPEVFDPAEETSIRVVVTGVSREAAPGTGLLHYAIDGEYTVLPMTEVEENVYDAVFPPLPCLAEVSYYLSAETTDGDTVLHPSDGPGDPFTGVVYSGLDARFEDDFESDRGWTVENEDLADGAWERGVPVTGGEGVPPSDHDGSGQCYLTGNRAGNADVDGGPTRLVSPSLDATGMVDPRVRYARWFYNDDIDEDRFDVEISADDGGTWALVESAIHFPTWQVRTWRIADFVEPTDRVRLRFSTSDEPNDSKTEAAIDAVSVFDFVCNEPRVPGDVDGDGDVDFDDLIALLGAWGDCPEPPAECPADFDDDGVVGLGDLLVVLANWT